MRKKPHSTGTFALYFTVVVKQMALLLETTLGDLVIDLDVEGSPALARNILDLAHARYYTQTLIYNVTPGRFCQLGDPRGDGSGGACWQGVLDAAASGGDVTKSRKRFLKSHGRRLTHAECQEKGRVVATEMKGIPDTIGSQFLVTLASGQDRALDGYSIHRDDTTTTVNGKEETTTASSNDNAFLSLGRVTEDEQDVLGQLSKMYCDAEGRPFADVRVQRISVVYNPFDDCAENDRSPEMRDYLKQQGVEWDNDSTEDAPWHVTASPDYDRNPEERVEPRISIDQIDMADYNNDNGNDDDEAANEAALAKLTAQQHEEAQTHDAKSRANVLEMLGDLPDAEIRAPENVLFVCKMNPVTEDEDLELIFSRFDPQVKAEIVRDHDTGASLQYAFVEFSTKQQASEAYFKMNNALVDDRRIKVDFSQSVATIWDKYNQKLRPSALSNHHHTGGGGGRGGGRGGRGRGPGGGRGRGGRDGGGRGGYHDERRRQDNPRNHNNNSNHNNNNRGRGGPPDQHRRRDAGPSQNDGRDHSGRNDRGDEQRRQDGYERERPRPGNNGGGVVDEFGRARTIPMEGNSSYPEDRHRNHQHQHDRRDKDDMRRRSSRSRSKSISPDRRRRDRSRSHSRSHSRKDRHSSSRHHHRDHKKKKRKHHDDKDRRHRRHDSPEDRRNYKRRYDSEDEEQPTDHDIKERHHHRSKRRYDSDASEEERRHSKKHSKHHKRRKRSRSRSRSR